MLRLLPSSNLKSVIKLTTTSAGSPRSLLSIRAPLDAPRLLPIICFQRSNTPATQRSFTHTPERCKKKSKGIFEQDGNRAHENKKINPAEKKGKEKTSGGETDADANDPFNQAVLEDEIKKALDRLREDLKMLRPGGRFNPEVLEHLKVKLDKRSKETSVLGSVAQVVPEGRFVKLFIADEDHLRPIISAIHSSNLNLTPTSDPTNSLQLNIAIPPPTQESQAAVLSEVAKKGESTHTAIKMARAVMHKKLRAMLVAKKARPDDIFKAEKTMEKTTEEGYADVKKVVKEGKKSLEQF